MSAVIKPNADGTVELLNGNGDVLLDFDAQGRQSNPEGLAYVGGATLVDGLSATFTNSTNNINATGIGVGVEVGDVIQISGAANAKNNSEFTVEVITDANNVIVNQAHAGMGTTSKSLVNETATVTVKLLCKWYLAPPGLGQGWVEVSSSRNIGVTYANTTNRLIETVWMFGFGIGVDLQLLVAGVRRDLQGAPGVNSWHTLKARVPKGDQYIMTVGTGTLNSVHELR